MKVTAPYDAHLPELEELDLAADPLNPSAGTVKKGEEYDVPSQLGERLVAQGWKSARQNAAKKAAKTRAAESGAAEEPPAMAPDVTDQAKVKDP